MWKVNVALCSKVTSWHECQSMCVNTLQKSYINDATRSFQLFQFVAQTAGLEKGIYIKIVSYVNWCFRQFDVQLYTVMKEIVAWQPINEVTDLNVSSIKGSRVNVFCLSNS